MTFLVVVLLLFSAGVGGGGVATDGIVDGQLQPSIVKMQRCTLNGCGKVG